MAQSGCLPISSLLIGVRRQSATRRRCGGSCPSAVRTTPSVRQGCSGNRQVGRRPLAVVHGLAFSNGWRRTWTSARIKCQTSSPPIDGLRHMSSGRMSTHHAKGVQHAKVKHPAAKQGLLLLIGCFFSHQPNFAVKPTPTSSACRFPARFALRCGLPVALRL